jgi:large subunit ribosomal protein L28
VIIYTMGKHCAITGKTAQMGNNVSHARNRTRRCFRPNLHSHRFVIPEIGTRTLYVSRKGLKQIVKMGGIVALLQGTHPRNLGEDGRVLKKELERLSRTSAGAA